MVYECIRSFRIEKYDDDCFPTGKYKKIKKGTKWSVNEQVNIIGGEIHMDLVNGSQWIEISNDTLKDYFIENEVNNEQNEL